MDCVLMKRLVARHLCLTSARCCAFRLPRHRKVELRSASISVRLRFLHSEINQLNWLLRNIEKTAGLTNKGVAAELPTLSATDGVSIYVH